MRRWMPLWMIGCLCLSAQAPPTLTWQADLAALEAGQAARRPSKSLMASALRGRSAARRLLTAMEVEDQWVRGGWQLPAQHGYLGTAEEAQFREVLLARSTRMDTDHTGQLKQLVDRWGWFDLRVWGEKAESQAWLLAQHADQDVPFQKRVLALMDPLVQAGGVDPAHQAYLWDRVAVAEHRPQRYGTQGRCTGPGRWEPRELEDPDHVDDRRAAVGLPPMADYVSRFKDICHDDQRGR